MENIREKIQIFNEAISVICKYDETLDEYLSTESFSEEHILEIIESKTDIDDHVIDFPGENDGISIAAVIDIASELDEIEIVDENYIKTKSRSYHIVETTDTHHEYLIRELMSISNISVDGVELRFSTSSLIVGMAAIKKGEYDRKYWPPCSGYSAIEVIYHNGVARLDREEENKLVQSYIFELADSAGIALQSAALHCPIEDYLYDDVEEKDTNIVLRDLISKNDGMSYFVSGVQIDDPELKFLSFYKVLEFFSPVALKIEGSELMRKKLDTNPKSFDDGEFIQSLFDLAKSVNHRFNDEDLIKAAFQECIDFPGLFQFLPSNLIKSVKKQLKIQEFNYGTNPQTIDAGRNMVAKIVYKTRNRVVHAKSNFELTGNEISAVQDFAPLNEFMKQAASQAIRWYSRLPAHLCNV